MRRRAGWVALTILVWGAGAVPAQAQGWRWLEKLSGPGDFFGFEYDQKLLCDYEELEPKARQEEQTLKPEIIVSAPCVRKRHKHPDFTKRVFAFGVSASYLRGKNDLTYAPTTEHIDRTIQVVSIETFYDHRLGRTRIDYGAAVGFNWFLVPDADDFTRVSLEPRLTFKLFDMKQGDKYVGTFGIRAGVLFFAKGFDADDFGAVPGTYRSGTEVSPSVRFVFDFDRNPLK
jgi:hypothetical protein